MDEVPHRPGVASRPSVQTDVIRILGTPASHYDIIQEGPFATVARTWVSITDDGEPQWVVVKSAPTLRKFAREPHDIVKELRLLSSMVHPNIVYVMGSFRDEDQMTLNIYLPYLPISISDLLASPLFSPHSFPSTDDASSPSVIDPEAQARQFTLISKSIMFQALAALTFLHSPKRRIAHRDIKPENLMVTQEGCVKLIDFGVAYKDKETEREEEAGEEAGEAEEERDLWPEYRGKLYFEVSTRAYRAPELLFGTRTYNPSSVDLWSLGATFAEFFTPLRLSSDDTDDGDDDDDTISDSDDTPGLPKPIPPFKIPRYLRVGYPGAQWTRESLFNGERGEIGLAWSIFKVFGTPTKENWPEFEDLPGAKSVVFNIVPSVPLAPLLPNLPPISFSSSSPTTPLPIHPALDLLTKLLTYPSGARLPAVKALRHSWFLLPGPGVEEEHVLLLPRGYELKSALEEDEQPQKSSTSTTTQRTTERGTLESVVKHEWKGISLGEWLHKVLLSIPKAQG